MSEHKDEWEINYRPKLAKVYISCLNFCWSFMSIMMVIEELSSVLRFLSLLRSASPKSLYGCAACWAACSKSDSLEPVGHLTALQGKAGLLWMESKARLVLGSFVTSFLLCLLLNKQNWQLSNGGLFELESKEPNNDKSSQNSATGILDASQKLLVRMKKHDSFFGKRRKLAKRWNKRKWGILLYTL